MPKSDWQRPKYGKADILEMETLPVPAVHPDEVIAQWEEHVLLLTYEVFESGGHEHWGMAWLVRNGEDPWHEMLRVDGPSPDDGDSERKMIKKCRGRIIGKVSR